MRRPSRERTLLMIASAACFLLAALIFLFYTSMGLMMEYPWGDFSLIQLIPILGVVLIIFGIIGISVAYEKGKGETPSDEVLSEDPARSNRDQ